VGRTLHGLLTRVLLGCGNRPSNGFWAIEPPGPLRRNQPVAGLVEQAIRLPGGLFRNLPALTAKIL